MIPFNPLSSPLPSPSSPPNPVFCTFITFFSVLVASFRAMKCMKALFTRSNRAHSKDNVKDPKDSDSLSPSASHQKGKPPQLPPLREWPPPSPPLEQPQSGSPTSITSYKPLPELSFLPLIEDSLVHFAHYDPRSISHFGAPLSDVAEDDSVDTAVGTRTVYPRADQHSARRSSRKTGNGRTNGSNDVPKKVAFLSPPTPSGLNADRPLPEDASASNASTVVRSQPSHPKDPCGSISTAASGSRPDVGSSESSTQTVKATWSEGADVTHLGPREQTPQEILSEFVASEERYVADLLKMKDAFIVPLLHPHSTSPVASPHQLPDDLRQCLEVIEDRILAGNLKLSEGLRKRYDEQYPLVRSLADVVVANSHILRGYADYVLHLERALEQANDVISSNLTKRPKNMDVGDWLKFCTFLRKLENDAQDRGETGLAISLSEPFQRLLKYPLLFQNLLFHTDPSTSEYESTLHMIAEIENIVRSVEDEKIHKEKRDKTRDILARIEGLDKVKQLAAPKPSRVLVEERMAPPVGTTGAVRGETSFKRSSDVLGGVGGKKDMWLVVFNDVVLRCQRTGTTSLPLGSAHAPRENSVPELQGKSKGATTGRRNSTARPRNLYKFIKIENWTRDNNAQTRKGVVSMEDVVRSRAQIHSAVQPRIPDDDEGGRVDFDDNKSKPIAKRRPGPGELGTRHNSPIVPLGYSRESSANAKYGHRLFSANPSADRSLISGPSTSSVRRLAAPPDEGHSINVRVTRPAWDGITRTPVTSVQSTKRSRYSSQHSATTRTTTAPPNKVLSSPTPSEDFLAGPIKNMPYPFPGFGLRENSKQEQFLLPPSPGLPDHSAEGDHEGKGEQGAIVVEFDKDEEVEFEQEPRSSASNSLSSLGQPIHSRYPFAYHHPGYGSSISSTASLSSLGRAHSRYHSAFRHPGGGVSISSTGSPSFAFSRTTATPQSTSTSTGASRASRSEQPSRDGSLEAREREDSVGLL
ncbi:hypothetical protein V8E53_008688 [Lactarius tabidus]